MAKVEINSEVKKSLYPMPEPPFRACLVADWNRNAALAPLILAAGGIGGGLAAAWGFASFWVAAPVAAFAVLLILSLIFTAIPHA